MVKDDSALLSGKKRHSFMKQSRGSLGSTAIHLTSSVLCGSFVGAVVPFNAICLQSNTKRQNTDSQSLSTLNIRASRKHCKLKQCRGYLEGIKRKVGQQDSFEVLSGSFAIDEICIQSNTKRNAAEEQSLSRSDRVPRIIRSDRKRSILFKFSCDHK